MGTVLPPTAPGPEAAADKVDDQTRPARILRGATPGDVADDVINFGQGIILKFAEHIGIVHPFVLKPDRRCGFHDTFKRLCGCVFTTTTGFNVVIFVCKWEQK